MKKTGIIIAFLFLICEAHSQDIGRTIIGAKGGLNLANIGGEETDNAMKIAGHIGGYIEFYFYEAWDIQAELLLSWQGHAPATEFDNRLNLVYINIPVLYRYFPAEQVNLHIGPQFGLLMSAKTKSEGESFDVSAFFKSFDLGLALGGGYEFQAFDRDMNVNLRYIHGVTNIAAEGSGKRFNRVIQLSLGILLVDAR